jgi:hypothetical protein
VVDREVEDALARSFLAELPAEVVGRLRAEGERADYPAGTTVYRPRHRRRRWLSMACSGCTWRRWRAGRSPSGMPGLVTAGDRGAGGRPG